MRTATTSSAGAVRRETPAASHHRYARQVETRVGVFVLAELIAMLMIAWAVGTIDLPYVGSSPFASQDQSQPTFPDLNDPGEETVFYGHGALLIGGALIMVWRINRRSTRIDARCCPACGYQLAVEPPYQPTCTECNEPDLFADRAEHSAEQRRLFKLKATIAAGVMSAWLVGSLALFAL